MGNEMGRKHQDPITFLKRIATVTRALLTKSHFLKVPLKLGKAFNRETPSTSRIPVIGTGQDTLSALCVNKHMGTHVHICM